MTTDIKESMQDAMNARLQKLRDFQAQQPEIQGEGLEALIRLVTIAQNNSGQCKTVANFLLSCYNGTRFKFDLSDFRSLDLEIFEDCLLVLKMDYKPVREIHTYFKDGGDMFEKLAKDWKIRDHYQDHLKN